MTLPERYYAQRKVLYSLGPDWKQGLRIEWPKFFALWSAMKNQGYF